MYRYIAWPGKHNLKSILTFMEWLPTYVGTVQQCPLSYIGKLSESKKRLWKNKKIDKRMLKSFCVTSTTNIFKLKKIVAGDWPKWKWRLGLDGIQNLLDHFWEWCCFYLALAMRQGSPRRSERYRLSISCWILSRWPWPLGKYYQCYCTCTSL